jgi:hypothetical protein
MDDKKTLKPIEKKGIFTFDLQQFLPLQEEIFSFDLKPFLFKELILKEQDFRDALSAFDWESVRDKWVYLHCSNQAIIPMWAYMLVSSMCAGKAKWCAFATDEKAFKVKAVIHALETHDFQQYEGMRIVIKGCGDAAITEELYVAATMALQPFARSIMYGEPCSTVPVFKRLSE